MEKNENPIDRLLNVEDNAPITLYDENDNAISFEQIALIPYEEKLYAILKPIDVMEGVSDEEGVIFVFEENEETGETYLKVVNDDKIIDVVFGQYLDLIKKEEEKIEKAEKKETTKKSPEKKTTTKSATKAKPKTEAKKPVKQTKTTSKTTKKTK